MAEPQMTKPQKLVLKYIRILAYLSHESLHDIERKTGQDVIYLVKHRPDSLPKYVLYLPHKIYNELKLGDLGPFDDLIQQLSARVHDVKSFYTYVDVLAYIKYDSLSKVSKALGYSGSYVSDMIRSGNEATRELCKPMASVMKISPQFLTIPLKNVKLRKPLNIDGLGSARTRIKLLVRLSVHAHYDTFSSIMGSHGKSILLSTLFRRLSVPRLIDKLDKLIPYLSKTDMNKAKDGNVEPFDKILNYLALKVNDRKSFSHYFTCVLYAYGTTAPKISVKIGHGDNYVDSSERKGSKPALRNVCEQVADYLGIDRSRLLKPLNKVKFSSKEHGYAHTVTDKRAKVLQVRMLSDSKELAKVNGMKPTRLSTAVFGKPNILWMTTRYSVRHDYQMLKQLMAYTDKSTPNVERLLKDLKQYLKERKL